MLANEALPLVTLVSAGPPIQMRSYEFELKTSGRPDLFSHDVYIYSYEECREKASIDNSIAWQGAPRTAAT